MTCIVYAAANYTPPSGIVVLPLEAHPAIIEDAQNEGATYRYRRRLVGTPLADQVVACLREHGEGTITEIADRCGMDKIVVKNVIFRHPERFEAVGERKVYMATATVWALVREET